MTLPVALLARIGREDLAGLRAWYEPEEEAELRALAVPGADPEALGAHVAAVHELKGRLGARPAPDLEPLP